VRGRKRCSPPRDSIEQGRESQRGAWRRGIFEGACL